MLLDEYVQELQRLRTILKRHPGRQVFSQELKNHIRAVAETWPNDVRPQVALGTDESRTADDLIGKVIEATYHDTSPRSYLQLLGALRDALIRLRVKTTVAMPGGARNLSEDNLAVERALEVLNPAIADSYTQVLVDVQDDGRISLRGTANELREVLREVLEVLSPDDVVEKEPWYRSKDELGREKHRPTYADRAKYAIRRKGKGKNVQRQTPASVERADELLGSIVRSTYDRGSGAAHTETERAEIVKQLRYVNAILLELLPAQTP
jgi:hypothetical protein